MIDVIAVLQLMLMFKYTWFLRMRIYVSSSVYRVCACVFCLCSDRVASVVSSTPTTNRDDADCPVTFSIRCQLHSLRALPCRTRWNRRDTALCTHTTHHLYFFSNEAHIRILMLCHWHSHTRYSHRTITRPFVVPLRFSLQTRTFLLEAPSDWHRDRSDIFAIWIDSSITGPR